MFGLFKPNITEYSKWWAKRVYRGYITMDKVPSDETSAVKHLLKNPLPEWELRKIPEVTPEEIDSPDLDNRADMVMSFYLSGALSVWNLNELDNVRLDADVDEIKEACTKFIQKFAEMGLVRGTLANLRGYVDAEEDIYSELKQYIHRAVPDLISNPYSLTPDKPERLFMFELDKMIHPDNRDYFDRLLKRLSTFWVNHVEEFRVQDAQFAAQQAEQERLQEIAHQQWINSPEYKLQKQMAEAQRFNELVAEHDRDQVRQHNAQVDKTMNDLRNAEIFNTGQATYLRQELEKLKAKK